MFTNENDLIVNNVNLAPYLISIKYEYSKVWGEDTGRNTLNAKFSGTFKGVNTKITPTFKKNLKSTEVQMLSNIFDTPSQEVKYRNPRTNQIRTFTSYSGDWSINYSGYKRNTMSDISFIDEEVI